MNRINVRWGFGLLAISCGVSASGATLSPCRSEFIESIPKITEASGTNGETCFRSRLGVTVCRVKLDGNPEDGTTSEVIVSKDGAEFARWREDADPHQLRQIEVLSWKAKRPPKNRLLIATLQSESQGMGVQSWLVSVLDLDRPDTRRVWRTAEFSATGSVVTSPFKPSRGCVLLQTEWTTRNTRSGDRLFLQGRLIDPFQSLDLSATVFSRRFDKSFEALRLSEPWGRPAVYFKLPGAN